MRGGCAYVWLTLCAQTDFPSPSVTDGLNTTTLKARLRWWLTMADKTDDGTAVSRRIALAARSALGKFQVRIPYHIWPVCPLGLILIQ